MTNYFAFEPDLAAKKIHVVREFNAPIEKVWRAFTEPDLLDKWVGPKPWTAVTKIWDFKVGGIWLYAMVSPEGQYAKVSAEGQKHWSRVEFTAIEKGSAFSSNNMFSDEDGNTVAGAPKSYTETKFLPIANNRTKVEVVKTFTDEAIIKMFVEMGFESGTITGYNQLDELLAS